MADDPLRAEATRAALRLQHDLGRYIRFWAPEETEADTEALRERLTRDVLATRSGPEGAIPAAAVFESWLAEEGKIFAGPGVVEPVSLVRLRLSMAELKTLAARLPGLGRPDLERLDALTRAIAEDTRHLVKEAKGA